MKAKDLRRILASKGCFEIFLARDYCAGSNEISSRVWEEDG